MVFDELIKGAIFQGCTSSLDAADTVLIGAGYDGTSSYRAGSRFAPQAIRAETLLSQEDYSPYFDADLSERAVHDAGDIELTIGNKTGSLQAIRRLADAVHKLGKRPFFIGGEHLVTLPLFESALQRYPDLVLVQLDAHLDMIDELFGDKLSHGTVVRRIFDALQGDGSRIYQAGIRSGGREEFAFARKHTRLFPFDTVEFRRAVASIGDVPVYLTLDLDVFDPSLLPGTGTPEAGGIFFREFVELLHELRQLKVVAADIVELAPKIDPTAASTAVASKTLREMLIAL